MYKVSFSTTCLKMSDQPLLCHLTNVANRCGQGAMAAKLTAAVRQTSASLHRPISTKQAEKTQHCCFQHAVGEVRRPWGACWMVSVTERVKTLFLSPLQPKNGGGGVGGRGGGGRGGIPCPLPSRPPHLRQPFQLTPTPSPAPHQETFQNDEKFSLSPLWAPSP